MSKKQIDELDMDVGFLFGILMLGFYLIFLDKLISFGLALALGLWGVLIKLRKLNLK